MSIKPFTGNSISFITTDDCTARCPHCIMCCTPGQKHYLTFEQMRETIDSVRAKEDLALVVFTGGEPTLLKNDLLKAIRYCDDLGILTRIVTNAHWATSFDRAREILHVLRVAGLGELNFSIDDYHAPYVPVENVKNAWKASKGMGFSAVVLANSHGEHDTIGPEYIQELMGETIQVRDADHRHGMPEEKRDEDGTLYIISEGRLQKTGRAAEEVDEDRFEQVDDISKLNLRCALVAIQPSISFTNHMWACCGIEGEDNEVLKLGDLNTESAADVMERASNSVLINAIHYLGPLFLMRFVEERNPNIDFGSNFHSMCEICKALTDNREAVLTMRMHYLELTSMIIEMEKREEQEIKQAAAEREKAASAEARPT